MAEMLFFSMLAPCAELSVLKPSQASSNKCRQHRSIVRASTLVLGAGNQHDTNLDIGVEISFMKMIK